jgi:hypothetical protein
MTTHTESVHVRLPRDLIEHVKQQADQQGVSMNAYLATLIAGATGWAPGIRTPEGKPWGYPSEGGGGGSGVAVDEKEER